MDITKGFAVITADGRVLGFAKSRAEAVEMQRAWENRAALGTCRTAAEVLAWADAHPEVRVAAALDGYPLADLPDDGDDDAPLVVFTDPEARELRVLARADDEVLDWCARNPGRVERLVTLAATFELTDPKFAGPFHGVARAWSFGDGHVAAGWFDWVEDRACRADFALDVGDPVRRSDLRRSLVATLWDTAITPWQSQRIRKVRIRYRGV